MLMGNIQGLDIQIPHEIAQYWGWFLAFGIALVVLGVAAVVRAVTATIISMLFFGWLLVLAQWPVSGLWVIGLFVGIDLIFYGGAWIALALGLRGS